MSEKASKDSTITSKRTLGEKLKDNFFVQSFRATFLVSTERLAQEALEQSKRSTNHSARNQKKTGNNK